MVDLTILRAELWSTPPDETAAGIFGQTHPTLMAVMPGGGAICRPH